MRPPRRVRPSNTVGTDDGWAPLPVRARLEALPSCQLRCPSCPTTAGAIRPAIASGQLTPALFDAFLDQSPSVRRLELSNYGEVFLNKSLGEILEKAAARNVVISLGNGANLNHMDEGMADVLVRTGVTELKCSIDGATQETYAKYRVKGDLSKVLANIDLINAAKKRHGSALPNLIWQFIVFGHNEHEIEAARGLAALRGMTFKAKISWDDDVSPVRDVEKMRRETGLPPTRAAFQDETGKAYLGEICHQLWSEPQFNWNGDNLGCCRNFWGQFGGNAIKDGLEASFNGEKMKRARRMLLGLEEPSADVPCTSCDLYLAMRKTGRYLKGSA
ncbi:MAG: radical SAM protein [Vicinamibacteria bacterium]